MSFSHRRIPRDTSAECCGLICCKCVNISNADVAELADALDSKSSTRESMWVRPPPSAPSMTPRRKAIPVSIHKACCNVAGFDLFGCVLLLAIACFPSWMFRKHTESVHGKDRGGV